MADVVGWLVYRENPWHLMGPFPTFERAVEVGEEHGVEYRMGFGLRRDQELSFTALPEPDES